MLELVKEPHVDTVSTSADIAVQQSLEIERESTELQLLGEISTIAVETRKALTNPRPNSCETPVIGIISSDVYDEWERTRPPRRP